MKDEYSVSVLHTPESIDLWVVVYKRKPDGSIQVASPVPPLEFVDYERGTIVEKPTFEVSPDVAIEIARAFGPVTNSSPPADNAATKDHLKDLRDIITALIANRRE